MSGNQALDINTDQVSNSQADLAITTHGSDWYWAVCAIMVVSTFAFLGMSMTKPRSHRLFHYITASITMVAAIAYFSMASNLGWVGIDIEFVRDTGAAHGFTREIFYVRYIDWFITTPLLLLDLLLTAGMPAPTLAYTLLIDEIMIVTGLVGALVSTSYKWGYYTFGCFALFYILYMLGFEARRHANHLGADIGKVFLMTGAWTSLLWLLYPIAWGVSEGGNVIHPDSEAVFYGILDVMAKPVFGAILLFGHRNIDPSRLGLHIRDYDDKDFSVRNNGAGHHGHHNKETVPATTGTTGTTTTGATTTAPVTTETV